eukprot:TRINITY_DN75773_c0_g1_i1.p1 TRINITY_DN75773_c0_g1~~TRINITY_DN75773_c0_g1_i1.p1  ORF type:complete len:132 (-),score=12.13 TRINITY_DN75773_c0_g1_i1:213-608(-)
MSTLTSVDMNIDRSSTRLFAPPGGKSSISFGDDDSANVNKYPTKTKQQNPITQAENMNPQPKKTARGYHGQSSICFGDDSTPAPTKQNNPVNTNTNATNNITAGKVSNFPQNNTSVRVRQAPGGTSSITFG